MIAVWQLIITNKATATVTNVITCLNKNDVETAIRKQLKSRDLLESYIKEHGDEINIEDGVRWLGKNHETLTLDKYHVYAFTLNIENSTLYNHW